MRSRNAYLVGITFSADIPTTADGFQDATTAVSSDYFYGIGPEFYALSIQPAREAYFAVLTPDGSTLSYGTYLGGYYTVPRGYDPLNLGEAIARGGDGSIFVGGRADTSSFPATDGGISSTMSGGADGFITRFKMSQLHVTTSSVLPKAAIEQAYAQQLSATGGTPPYSWQVVGFVLPDGLQMDAEGRIFGTAQNPQMEDYAYQFTVKVTDATGATAYKNHFIAIQWPSAFICSAGACSLKLIPDQSFRYPIPVLARGVAPFYLTVNGALPPGTRIEPDGWFSGTISTRVLGTSASSLRILQAAPKRSPGALLCPPQAAVGVVAEVAVEVAVEVVAAPPAVAAVDWSSRKRWRRLRFFRA